jgi:hypothetical protein
MRRITPTNTIAKKTEFAFHGDKDSAMRANKFRMRVVR